MRMFEVVKANRQYAGSFIFKNPKRWEGQDRSKNWMPDEWGADESNVCSWVWSLKRPCCTDGVWGREEDA